MDSNLPYLLFMQMINRIWKRFIRFYYRLQIAIDGRKTNQNLIIILSDGGVCSQIAFWALGLFYEQCGFRVKYDLSWFQQHGMDMNKRFVRNYDLTKAFPEAVLPVASDYECFSLKKYHRVEATGEKFKDILPPAFITGYPNRAQLVIHHRLIFRKYFKIDEEQLSPQNVKILSDITECEHACAIHVRRGDLSKFNIHYGEPLTADYFNAAINTILERYKNTHFFFFSDEISWIQSDLIPSIKNQFPHTIVTGNGSDKGYIDLYLMSKCDSFVTSQGSLGKFARILRSDDALVIEPSSKVMFEKELLENVVVL